MAIGLQIAEAYFGVFEFLTREVIINNFIYFDFWSIVHIFSGVIIMALVLHNKIKKPYRILFSVLAGFELIEYFLGLTISNLVTPEMPLDTFWDLIFGMFGGYIYKKRFFLKRRNKKGGKK